MKRGRVLGVAVAAVVLGACASLPSRGDRADRLQQEQFGSTDTHSRDFGAPGPATCEAARRALLSQGYVISLADADKVNGKKNFQPDASTHLEVEFHIVCAPADRQGRKSIAFVNALQDRYALKKSNNSASLGVGVLGSVSLPFTSSDDAMVRVASETITTQTFYDRFFALVDRYLIADSAEDILPEPKPPGLAEAKPGTADPAKPVAAAGPAASAPEPKPMAAPAPAAVGSEPKAANAGASAPSASSGASGSTATSPAAPPAAEVAASSPARPASGA